MFFFEDVKPDENEAIVNQKKIINNYFKIKLEKKKQSILFLVNLNYILLKSTKHFNVSLKIKFSRAGFSCPPLSALDSLLAKVI